MEPPPKAARGDFAIATLTVRLDEAPHKWMVRQHGATVFSARTTPDPITAVVPAGLATVSLVRLTDDVVVHECGISALAGRALQVSVPLP